MAYRTDGSSHFNGIELEQEIVNFINKSYENGRDVLNIYKDIDKKLGSVGKVVCVHKGGTGNKSDAIVMCTNAKGEGLQVFTISIKRKKYENGRPKGTFDVINTTLEKFNSQYNIISPDKIRYVNNWLESKKPFIKSDDDIDAIRDDFADLCNMLLEETIHDADKFIELTKKEFFKTDILIVGKTIEEFGCERVTEIYVAKEKDVKLFDQENLSGNKYYLEKGRGKSSRTLMVETYQKREYKTPFRVRLVLNNGLSAYFGLSEANNTSFLTIKIQVDGVQYIVDQMKSFRLD